MGSFTTQRCSVRPQASPTKHPTSSDELSALTVANLVLFLALPLTRAEMGTMLNPVLRASYSVIGSRIMLNLRGALSKDALESIRMGATIEFLRTTPYYRTEAAYLMFTSAAAERGQDAPQLTSDISLRDCISYPAPA